ncbi:hypothetical protein [Mucilaginibacter kameinonensis]|uniref:hypothetical protein n=1 Tax=Mucilaginibacter kameinonensis TaxID=452286 RepID=UPI0013CEAB53|nr:hypothetical protein [Mucilaginibacter kameinonensis]
MSNLNFKIYLIEDNGSYAELECESLGDEFTTSFSTTVIQDISQRLDSLSKNISLKATPNNNRVLGNLYSPSRFSDTTLPEKLYYNFSPNRGVQCQIFEDSIMIFKGTLKITGVDLDSNGNYTYSAVVTGSLVDFFGKIGNDLLSNVFVTDYHHHYTLTNIVNSWNMNYNDGLTEPYHDFFYPQIDYGKTIVQNPGKFDLRNFRTGVYLKTYFDNIFQKYGYTYSGDFINSDIFKKCFIPYAEQEFSNAVKKVFYTDVTTGATTYNFTSLNHSAAIDLGAIVDSQYIKRQTRTFTGVDVHTYVLTRNVTTQLDLSVNFSATSLDGTGSTVSFVLFQLDTSGTPITSTNSEYLFPTSGITGSTHLSLALKSYLKGEGFGIVANTTSNTASITVNNAVFNLGASGVTSQVEIVSGDTINLRDVVPQNVMVKDFLKSLLKFFNLYFLENPNVPNDIIIEPFDSFYQKALTPATYAYDWTKKVDLRSASKISFNTQLPSVYNFKFKTDDNNYYNKLYTTKYADVSYGDFSITNSKGVAAGLDIEVDFSPTIIVKENGDDKILPAIFKGELTAKQSYKSNLRILFNNGYTSCNPYDIVLTNSGDTVTYTTVSSGLTLTNKSSHILTDTNGTGIFSLLFGVPNEVYMPLTQDIFTLPNIYSDFYQNQILELNDDNVAVFDFNVLLSATDVSNLDMRTPVYIQTKAGGMYAKILNIDYYNSKETSQVKLQKIVL